MRPIYAPPGSELARWQAAASWRVGRLPAAVDRRNTSARRGILRQLEPVAPLGQGALLTINAPEGIPRTYQAAAAVAAELARLAGLKDAYVTAHVYPHPHGHVYGHRDAMPTVCPVCGTAIRPGEYVTHSGEIRQGNVCAHGCCHWSHADSLKAVVAYMAGPVDARAHWSPAHRVQAAEFKLSTGRVVMRGRLSRFKAWKGVPLRRLILSSRLKRIQRAKQGHRIAVKAPATVAPAFPLTRCALTLGTVSERRDGHKRRPRPGGIGVSSHHLRAIRRTRSAWNGLRLAHTFEPESITYR